jgi:hypothetical protein
MDEEGTREQTLFGEFDLGLTKSYSWLEDLDVFALLGDVDLCLGLWRGEVVAARFACLDFPLTEARSGLPGLQSGYFSSDVIAERGEVVLEVTGLGLESGAPGLPRLEGLDQDPGGDTERSASCAVFLL